MEDSKKKEEINNNVLHIDLRPNTLNLPKIKKQAEESLQKTLNNSIPHIIERQGKLPSFIIKEYGKYSNIMSEARSCYEFGFFYASVSLICISAEKFVMELSKTTKHSHDKKLVKLKNDGSIKQEHYEKLKEIASLRKKYLHPRTIKEEDKEKDSLRAILLFNKVLQDRFHERYEIKEGVIFEKNTDISFKIIIP